MIVYRFRVSHAYWGYPLLPTFELEFEYAPEMYPQEEIKKRLVENRVLGPFIIEYMVKSTADEEWQGPFLFKWVH